MSTIESIMVQQAFLDEVRGKNPSTEAWMKLQSEWDTHLDLITYQEREDMLRYAAPNDPAGALFMNLKADELCLREARLLPGFIPLAFRDATSTIDWFSFYNLLEAGLVKPESVIYSERYIQSIAHVPPEILSDMDSFHTKTIPGLTNTVQWLKKLSDYYIRHRDPNFAHRSDLYQDEYKRGLSYLWDRALTHLRDPNLHLADHM